MNKLLEQTKEVLEKYNINSLEDLENELRTLEIYRCGLTVCRLEDEDNTNGYIFVGEFNLSSSHCPQLYEDYYQYEYSKNKAKIENKNERMIRKLREELANNIISTHINVKGE